MKSANQKYTGPLPVMSVTIPLIGRETEVAEFVERLREQPVMVVVGPSGAGKSSFVRAGVLPRLRERGPLLLLLVQPGQNPFLALASKLIFEWEKATEEHGVEISYTWTRLVLQAAGLAEKSPGRGKYRRKRERRAMRGMLVHLDASTHEWIEGLPMWDLMVALDDADGRILYARFVPQESTLSSLAAVKSVIGKHGRFCELYTDISSLLIGMSR